MQWRELIKNNAMILIITIVAYFLSYLLNVYLARLLSPELYGDISIAMRTLALIAPISLLGTQYSSNRFLSQYSNSDRAKFLGFYRWSMNIFKISAITILFLCLFIYIAIYFLDADKITQFSHYHLVTWVLWAIPLFGIAGLQSAFLQSTQNYFKSILITIIYPVLMMTAVFFLHLVIPSINVFYILALIGLAYIPIVIYQRIFVAKNLKFILSQEVQYSPDYSIKKHWLTTSLGKYSINLSSK